MNHQKETAAKVACSESLVGDGIHFGLITHVWEEGVVKHTSPVQSHVGHHEHDERPYPSGRYPEVRGEGEKNTRHGTDQGQNPKPPQLDHAAVGDDTE